MKKKKVQKNNKKVKDADWQRNKKRYTVFDIFATFVVGKSK